MDARPVWPRWLLFLGAWVLAAAGAVPYAGGWNDGSRLASVEALVDQHTLAIDASIFVQPARAAKGALPYSPQQPQLLYFGTLDKLWIDGHFYSDKPPVAAFLMAVLYQLYLLVVGVAAAVRPDWFCWFMTATTSGLAYALAVVWLERLGRRAGLTGVWLGMWLGSFALATVALTYTRHVNNHIMLLAVIAGLLWQLVVLADEVHLGAAPWLRWVWVGTLGGLGYTLDQGSGPVLLATLLPLILIRTRRLLPWALFLCALAPWLIAHHALNYALGGTLQPANAVAAYCAWPDSPFHVGNMTGFLRHAPGKFVVYVLALLFGKHGFIGHNLALWLTLPALWLLSRRGQRTSEGLFAAAWVAGTFLMYAAFSNNYGGACCSIRWFVPFLAPGFWMLARLLVHHPQWRGDFAVLSGWGFILAAIMWWHGPWIMHMVPLLWPLQGATLASAAGYRLCSSRLSFSVRLMPAEH